MNLEEEIKNCYSLSAFCKVLGLHNNGNNIKKVKKIILNNNLDSSHFNGNLKAKIKYETIEKNCPVCEKKFTSQKREDRYKKTTCSYACSNTYFRTGINNPNWKENSKQYRNTCFFFHKKECVICGENKVIEVHHMDENRSNNKPENLVPLCPTHHKYWHSKYKNEVEEKIHKYVNEVFKNI